jgi:molybdate transport repressor ModE-like protein
MAVRFLSSNPDEAGFHPPRVDDPGCRRPPLPARLIELLVQVAETGSLLLAARSLGLSYRRAWDLVRQGEQQFDAQLLVMERGRGSTLTDLGQRIVWADKRIHARLKPSLESLSSELAEELRGALSESPSALRIHASHGFAIERLIERLHADGLKLALNYASSSAAAAALREGDCDVAGLHIPIGPMEDMALAHYRPWLSGMALSLVDIATRRQGLMVRPGNPKELFSLADLARPSVRFINRQVGSGTRLLLEGCSRPRTSPPPASPASSRANTPTRPWRPTWPAAWPTWASAWSRRPGSSSWTSCPSPPSATSCCAATT